MRRRAELLYQQLDGLQALRRNLRPEFLAESRKHKAAKLLRQIPCIGPIRAARLIALMQTPHRFRSKRQLWTYSGLGIETHDSAQYRYVGGQVQRSKKPQQIRGLNQNHNHEMKEIFKSTAIRASCGMGPFNRRLLAMRKCILRSIAIVSLVPAVGFRAQDIPHAKNIQDFEIAGVGLFECQCPAHGCQCQRNGRPRCWAEGKIRECTEPEVPIPWQEMV